jgi:RNA polymerase sigma-70 factor (ECF subfamily)
VSVLAVPNRPYVFDHWVEDGTTGRTRSFVVGEASRSATAIMRLDCVAVTFAAAEQIDLGPDEVSPSADTLLEPAGPEARRLLERYIAAFEASDADALGRVLRDDAVLETDARTWFAGKVACVRFVRTQAMGPPGDWRLLPTRANGQPAAAAYLRGPDGAHHAFGVSVLTPAAGGIARINVFGDPALVARFGGPAVL